MGDACGVTQGCVNCGCAGIALGFGNCGWTSGDCFGVQHSVTVYELVNYCGMYVSLCDHFGLTQQI